jgi:hypothetical protein
MRAKYVKKLWYQDPSGGSPTTAAITSAIPAPTSPTTGSGSNGALAVPERVRAISKSQSIDVNNHIVSAERLLLCILFLKMKSTHGASSGLNRFQFDSPRNYF